MLQDVQGSTRAAMSGTSVDFLRFGEEIGAGTGLRTTGQGFSAVDKIRQRYGLTERDDTTGLDHSWWRKYENLSGRWTSSDPYRGSMTIANPQSFNLYSYVQNDPVNFVDPGGLCTFNIGINNNSLTAAQLQTMKNEISRIFGAADQTINFVSQNADYSLNINASASGYSANQSAVGVTYLTPTTP